MFSGSAVALVTPLKDGEIDLDKFAELIEAQIAGGMDILVPSGTTGESATMSHEEHHRVIECCVKVAAGRARILAGTGSNSTREAIALTRFAEKAGVDGALLVSPYYNKPTQDGLYRHYRAVAEAVGIPIVLYNVPGRTGKEIAVDTVARLAEINNVTTIKEAGGSVERVSQILCACDIQVVSGDDSLTLPMMAVGAEGVISVLANVVPADVKKLVDLAAAGDYAEARKLHLKMVPLVDELFRDNNPLGVKTALRLLGRINGEVRPPLFDVSAASEKTMRHALEEYGLL